jgi:SAM-dependent methyltransferase
MDSKNDAFSRVDYRRFVAWEKRIQRESGLLLSLLEQAPEATVLDLGCGSGEHSRFFATHADRVVGMDRSGSMLEKALEEPLPENLEFLEGDLRELKDVVTGRFGLAICLGNTLANLLSEEDWAAFLAGLRSCLLPGGVFLFQILNYQRIFSQNIRYLPLNFRRSDEGDLMFLRLIECLPDGSVNFCPSTLRVDFSREEPLEVLRSKTVKLMGWKSQQVLAFLEGEGFELGALFGDMEEGVFEADRSQNLVVVARL